MRHVRVVGALMGFLAVGAAASAQPAADGLFVAVASEPLRQVALAHAARIDSPARARHVVGMRLDRLFASDGRPLPVLRLNLPTATYFARFERVDHSAGGPRSWVGTLDGVANSHVVFTERGGLVSGLIDVDGEVHQVSTIGTGVHLIEELDRGWFKPELPPVRPPGGTPGPGAAAAHAVGGDDGSTIDVLVLYTPAMRVQAGGTALVDVRVAQMISDTNTAFARSGVATRVRLVGSGEFALTEHPADMSADLSAVTNSAAAQAARNQRGADLVQLLVHSSAQACGVGWLMSSLDAGWAPYGYSVADWRCMGQYTPSHEIGHNLGSHHAPEDGASGALFSYSYGFKSPARAFRTVMAYDCAGGCPRALNFSNPAVTYDGGATGASGQNNAQSINQAAFTVANFRQAVVPSGVSPPAAPAGLTSVVTGNRVRVAWNAPAGPAGSAATAYMLQVGSSVGASNVFNGSVGAATSAEGTVGAGTYYWRVIASNSAGTSAPSDEAQFSVICAAPGAPAGLAATVTGSSVTLMWAAPATGGSPAAYIVEAGSAPGLANLYNQSTGGTATTVVAQAPPGTYYVRVRAANVCGTSPPSNERTVVVP